MSCSPDRKGTEVAHDVDYNDTRIGGFRVPVPPHPEGEEAMYYDEPFREEADFGQSATRFV